MLNQANASMQNTNVSGAAGLKNKRASCKLTYKGHTSVHELQKL